MSKIITPTLKDGDLKDRLLGAVMGGALGDALALPFHGGKKIEEKEVTFPHTQLANRSGCFPLNDVSDKTDHAVLIMRTLTAYRRSGVLDPAVDFASRLTRWV